ncbi:MAG: PHP domain-containing protein, partial [Armatimonadetes bacterium]|nr:PHP domain-containing protein [Armatimonadota bacterium]
MYVELHCHSAYSFADGASLPEELAAWAERLGYPALALTDHNGLYGAMEFAQQMRGRELQPITGAEVTLEDGSHLTLLAENAVGYAHLSRLLSLAHLQHERGEPRVREEWLRQYGEGWIVLTGCGQGAVGRAAAAGDRRGAAAVLRRYREWFGPQNLFVELQHNLAYGDRSRLRLLTELARSLELGVVATNNVHYHRRERHRLQDALVAIRHRTTLDQSHHLRRPNSEFYLHAPQNMVRRYRSLPEAVQNTLAIAERCRAFDLTQHLGYAFPDFHEAGGATRSAQETLTEICRTELRARYGSTSPRVR